MGRVQIINITSRLYTSELAIDQSASRPRHARLKPVDKRRLDARERRTWGKVKASDLQSFFLVLILFAEILCFLTANITVFFILKTKISSSK